MILAVFNATYVVTEKAWKFKPKRDPNLTSDLCDASAVLCQLSYKANWEQVLMYVDGNPVDDSISR